MSQTATIVTALTAGTGMLLLIAPPVDAARIRRRYARRIPNRTGWLRLATAGGCALAAWIGVVSMFGAGPAASVGAVFGAAGGMSMVERQVASRRRMRAEVWPSVLDAMRIDLGFNPVPLGDALFAAAHALPAAVRVKFVAAERVWRNTLDLPRAVAVVASAFDDPVTDVVCESLRTMHALPQAAAHRRLAVIAQDVRTTVQHVKDADALLAGARFARRFVLIVPLVMGAVGVWVGEGRQAYATATGQWVGVAALTAMAACWWWAGRLLAVPQPPRVFRDHVAAGGAS